MSTSTFITIRDASGQVIGYGYSCKIDPDDPMMFAPNPEPDWEREQFLRRHDPNRTDSRRVNKRGRTVNLGMRVNRISSRYKGIL